MGWSNPAMPWSELERQMSGNSNGSAPRAPRPDSGDAPAFSRHREPYEGKDLRRFEGSFPYAELHCHSHFSFLDGASSPEELVEEAMELGLEGLALTDRNGLYGVVRFAEAARAYGLPTIFGSELTFPDGVGLTGGDLVFLAEGPAGYAALSRGITEGQMAGSKGAPVNSLQRMGELAASGLLVLSGTWAGPIYRCLESDGVGMARHCRDALIEHFGAERLVIELWDHGTPLCTTRNDVLAELAVERNLAVVASNDVRYANRSQYSLACSLTAVGNNRSLREHDPWLPAAGLAHLRSGNEQRKRFARYPGVLETSVAIAEACRFDLDLVAPELPPFDHPEGHDEMSWLRHLTYERAVGRYGTRHAESEKGAYAQLDRELRLIEELGFPGYFLIVTDIVDFCKNANIYCQGRGSAANSAVCYALGITNADAVKLGLLFERFLSPERDGPPDIDIDIESGRREEVIQYVYDKYGREHTAQVANLISYRSKSAVRDVAKALGYTPGQQDAFAKTLNRWGTLESEEESIPADVVAMAKSLVGAPRHLGIHSGGMVICDRPVVEVCPVEWARMENRSVLQWDKDDCAATGLVKFDLLGLGMLSALHIAVDLVAANHGVEIDIARLPPDDEAVYDMICRADTIGVFQIESRAQMATLPRLKPRKFYDLVVEVALIRPGPIQGGSVHPFIRRRNGQEEVTYLHPLLKRSLAKTLGVPLFQEQMMQVAIDVGGFSPAEADELRQAMAAKRSTERMERIRGRFYDGMAKNGIVGDVADQIWEKLAAFANYGFPESHSVSFAYLVYASCWIKRYYPAAFCAALMNAQPMGFYSPHTLAGDARRHGVRVLTPDVNESDVFATLEWSDRRGAGRGDGLPASALPGRPPNAWGKDGPAVRMGIASVRDVGDEVAEKIAAGRPWATVEDVRRHTGCGLKALEALATAGALDGLIRGGSAESVGKDRRAALWEVGAVAQTSADQLPGVVTGTIAPQLPGMSDQELAAANLWATGVAPDGHPTVFCRETFASIGVVPSSELLSKADGDRVMVAGVVTHRQRPSTAGGVTFLNLEDEFGLTNVVVSQGCWQRHQHVAQAANALIVRGRLEIAEGVVNLVADKIVEADIAGPSMSRDFR